MKQPVSRINHRWRQEDVERLERYVAMGLPTVLIARLMNRTNGAIRTKAKKGALGLKLSGKHDHVLPFLKRGNHLICEDVPPLGMIWRDAALTGLQFDAAPCEVLASLGVIVQVPEREKIWKLNR